MNKHFLDDRRRALEEQYFAKLNRKLLDRLRAAEAMADKPRHSREVADIEDKALLGR